MRKNSSFNHFVMLATAAVAMLMASCIKDEVVDVPFIPTESETIGFGINLENLDDTRASSRNRVGKHDLKSADGEFTLPMGVYVEDGIGCADAAETRGAKLNDGSTIESFTVWASLTGTNGQTSLFFPAEGEEFTKNDNNIFVSNPEHFWPGAGTIDFVAVANAPTSGFTPKLNSDGTALESFTYTVPAAAADQKDIVVAKPDDPVSGANNKSVPLNFKHIMSAVNFTVGEKVANGVIKSITINNIKTTGSYNVATGTWTPNTDSKDSYSVAFSSTVNGNYEPNDKSNGTIINDDKYTFMMMPQVLDADAEVVVEFIYDNAPSDVKQLRANIAIDPENTSQRREWAMGKTTYYSISIDENYNLTITPKGDVLDAHYVMTDVTVNIDTETDQAWTLTVEATHIDSEKVSIEYKDELIPLITSDGYWIDKIIDGTTTTFARGDQTVTGTTKGEHTITVFIPENITANERKITLTLSLDSDPTKKKKTEYLYQMCPYWDTNKGFGWERVENSEEGQYGFIWDRVVCYTYVYDMDRAHEGQWYNDSYFNSIVDPLIQKYNASQFVFKRAVRDGLGYRNIVIIDYTKINESDYMKTFSTTSGLENTKAFFDAANVMAFELALSNVYKVESDKLGEHAFDIRSSDATLYKFNKKNIIQLPNTEEPYVDGNNVSHSTLFGEIGTLSDMSGILNYIIKRNSYNVVKSPFATQLIYEVQMDSNNIKWYLPAVNQYKDPVLSFATGNTTFTPANFWSSTADEDNNSNAFLGDETSVARTNTKQVVVQRIVTPIPQPTTISEINTEEMKGGENGEAQWVE